MSVNVSYSSAFKTYLHQTTEGNQNTSTQNCCTRRRMLTASLHSTGRVKQKRHGRDTTQRIFSHCTYTSL